MVFKFNLIDLAGVKASVLSRLGWICPDKDAAYTFLGKHYNSRGKPAEAMDACTTRPISLKRP